MKAAVLFASTAAAVAAAEAFLAAFAPQKEIQRKGLFQFSPILEYELRPNCRGRYFKPEFGWVKYSITSQGFRDHREYGPKGEAFRILALGDSFFWGDAVAYDQTYLCVLERLLQERMGRRRVEIIKAGVPSYDTRKELIYYQHKGRAFHADLVLVGFPSHDAIQNLDRIDVESWRRLKDLNAWERLRPPGRGAAGFAERFHLYHLCRKAWNRAARACGAKPRGQVAVPRGYAYSFARDTPGTLQAWRETIRLFHGLAAAVESDDARLAVVVIPQYEEVYFESAGLPLGNYAPGKPGKIMAEFGRRRGVAVLDLFPILRACAKDATLYYPRDGHLTPAGCAAAARATLHFVCKQGLAPAKAK